MQQHKTLARCIAIDAARSPGNSQALVILSSSFGVPGDFYLCSCNTSSIQNIIVNTKQASTMISAIDFNDDSWWENFLHDDDNDDRSNNEQQQQQQPAADMEDAGSPLPKPLVQLMQQSSAAFFNQSMSKGDFFQVCCLYWMQTMLQPTPPELVPHMETGNGETSTRRPVLWSRQSLYHSLVDAYKDGIQPRDKWIVQWILPPRHAMDVTSDDDDAPTAAPDLQDWHYMDRWMKFWKQLFQAMQRKDADDDDVENMQPPAKKRRRLLGKYRDDYNGGGTGASSYSSLLKGNYKLAAAYLCISVLKESCQNWDQVQDQAHQLASLFPTFAGRDIDAALALVGLQSLCNGSDSMQGLGIEQLFSQYLTNAE
jgi:hypothetical protein